jgi:hypothetical protein
MREASQDEAGERLFAQIVAVGFRHDLPAVAELHRHQLAGEIARRQLAAYLDEGGGTGFD